ncbi:MAG: hypothetical protein ACI4RT_00575 [Candidatus Spyradenecus sp.]
MSSIKMTRWSDVVFVALLLGGSVSLVIRESSLAANYDCEYADYRNKQEAAYQTKAQETTRQMAEAEAQFEQQKVALEASNKAELVKHQQAGKTQLLNIQKRIKATVSMLDFLKNRAHCKCSCCGWPLPYRLESWKSPSLTRKRTASACAMSVR